MGTHGFRYAHLHMVAAPRTDSPPPPSGGTREHSYAPKPSPLRWWEQGPCARQGHDSVWLSPSKYPKDVVHAAAAQCAKCPVKTECAAQPYPHVGITAGRIYWEGTRYSASVKVCALCAEQTSRNSRFCSQSCKDRWHYLDRLKDGERPFEPLYDWLKRKPLTVIAEECGVHVRTVYRWDASGIVPAGAVKQVVKRLRVDIEDIWPVPNFDHGRTDVRSGVILGREEPGALATTPSPSEDTPVDTGDASMTNVRHLPTPVKFGQGS